jgi:adenine phosphoribosyltransferase
LSKSKRRGTILAKRSNKVVDAARDALLARFAWESGHADIWQVFLDGPTLTAVIAGLVEPWRAAGITHIAGIESRGFLLGGAVADHLGVGFLAVRKSGGILPRRKIFVNTAPDYRGTSHQLRIQNVLDPNAVVLLVDDWAERGSQADGVRLLVEQTGAQFVGVSLLVDQLDDSARAKFGRVTSLVRASELGEPEAKASH